MVSGWITMYLLLDQTNYVTPFKRPLLRDSSHIVDKFYLIGGSWLVVWKQFNSCWKKPKSLPVWRAPSCWLLLKNINIGGCVKSIVGKSNSIYHVICFIFSINWGHAMFQITAIPLILFQFTSVIFGKSVHNLLLFH